MGKLTINYVLEGEGKNKKISSTKTLSGREYIGIESTNDLVKRTVKSYQVLDENSKDSSE